MKKESDQSSRNEVLKYSSIVGQKQQYHFEHNFGHGQKHLCTYFAFLMMAFTVDQIQQFAANYFKVILNIAKVRMAGVFILESNRIISYFVLCK